MKLLSFPEFRQTYNYDCGANALQTVLEYYGVDVREDKLMRLAGTNKNNGTPISGIIKVLKKNKLRFKVGELSIKKLKKYIDEKIPVIILLQAWTEKKKVDWEKDWKDGHYVVAIGYSKNKFYFQDPSSPNRTYLTYKEMEKRWHDEDEDKRYVHYGIVVYGKKPRFNLRKIIHMD
jgi:predicted double-glycine peptidase